ncbi:MAG TPA: protein kinase [Ktedonobacteraceae bacterium]|nr:protein kinase [Ktedonobacteraceae bacterium]
MDDINQKMNIAYKKGERLGQYEVVAALEQTSFGQTYLCEHMYLRTQVTIEVFQLPLPRELREDFLTQTQALQQLDHPHILRIHEAGVQRHHPFLVTDYGSHRTFRQVYPQGSLRSLESLSPHIKQIASALQYAHDRRILHGDICPENVLLDRNNTILLRGFAIEATIQNRERLRYQRTGVISEAVSYAAPERIQGKTHPASDQYSLAMLIYELLCGVLPFTGSSIEVAHQQMHASLPPLKQKAPNISQEIENTVMKALAKEPGQRFANIQAFVNALLATEHKQFQTAEVPGVPAQATGVIELPVALQQSKPEPPTMPATPANAQNAGPGLMPQPTTPAGQMQTLAAANVGPSPIPSVDPHQSPTVPNVGPPFRPPAPLVQPATPPQAALPPVPQNIPPAQTPPANLPPAQRRDNPKVTRRAFAVGMVGLAALGGAGGWYLLSQRMLTPTPPAVTPNATAPATQTTVNNTKVLIFAGHLASVNALAWSPDGKLIASASDDTFVQIFDASNGNRKVIYSGHTEEVAAVSWSPDGKMIASGGQDKTVRVWDATSKENILSYTGHTGRVNGLSWSNDSSLVASGSDDKSVQVWNASNGEIGFTFLGHTAGVLCVGWQPDNTSVASGSWDGTLRDWATVPHGEHFNAGDEIFNYGGHGKNEVTALAWSPDSGFIVSAGADQTLQISNGADGTPIPPFFTGHQSKQHVNRVLAVSWSPDGNSIASGDADGNVYVWHTDGRRTFFRYRGHKAAVNAVAWSPDGKTIASASADNTVHVWRPA